VKRENLLRAPKATRNQLHPPHKTKQWTNE